MIDGVSLEQVKQYNESIKAYQDKAAHIRAGIEYSTNEINRLCAELTTELGVQVTPDNIRQIYAERVEKIKNMLSVGTEILSRIRQEEEAAAQASVPQGYGTIPAPGAAAQGTAVQGTAVQGAVTPPDGLAPPIAPVTLNLGFDNIGITPPNLGGIPPMFSR